MDSSALLNSKYYNFVFQETWFENEDQDEVISLSVSPPTNAIQTSMIDTRVQNESNDTKHWK